MMTRILLDDDVPLLSLNGTVAELTSNPYPLWRLDSLPRGRYLYINGCLAMDQSIGTMITWDYPHDLIRNDRNLEFRLANRLNGDDVYIHINELGAIYGFTVMAFITKESEFPGILIFDGILHVDDAECLRRGLHDGMGDIGHGSGLMTVKDWKGVL